MFKLKFIIDFLLDILFPVKCLGCKKEGEWICKSCLDRIELLQVQTCPKCNKPSKNGKFCCCLGQNGSSNSALSGIIIAARYQDKLLQKAIHAFKYRFIRDLAVPLSHILIKILKKTLFQEEQKPHNIILIPVPLHKRKILQRGFNQAELLAKEISKKFGMPLAKDKVIRTKNTKPQIELDPAARQTNVQDAFLCQKEIPKNKTIIIIDDVCTTSATLSECAKAIRAKNPSKKIWGLVLARG